MIGEVPKGGTASIPLEILDREGNPWQGFLATDQLEATLWAGDDRAAIAYPAASWDEAKGPPSYWIDFAPSDTASVAPGTYSIRMTVTRGADSPEVLRDTVEVLPVPGMAAAQPAYCTYQDMQRYCAWIGQYQDREADQTGFAEQRAMAREWMDHMILRAVPLAGGLSLISRQNFWTWTVGGSTDYGMTLPTDPVIKGYLDAGALVLTGPAGAKVVRATACYAIALVFGAQPDESATRQAARYRAMADHEASTLVAELDHDGDGVTELAFDLGSTNTKYG